MCVMQSELKRLQDVNNLMTKELSVEKEKLHTLEAAFERMRKQGLSVCVVITSRPVCAY